MNPSPWDFRAVSGLLRPFSGPFFSRLPPPVVLPGPSVQLGLADPVPISNGFHLKRVFFRLRSPVGTKQSKEIERAFSRPSFLLSDRNGFSTDPAAPTTCKSSTCSYYLYGSSLCPYLEGGGVFTLPVFGGGGGVFTLPVENSLGSHNPVEIGDLLLLAIRERG